jgi:hypothetical protein
VAGSVLAVTINSQGGSVLTFALPVGVFVVVAAVLYVLFSRPYARIQPYRRLATAQAGEQAGEHQTRTEGSGQEAAADASRTTAAEESGDPSEAAEPSEGSGE